MQEKVFSKSKAFEMAELAKLNDTERSAYEDSLKYYRDVNNSLDTAKEEGIEIDKELGREEEKTEGIKRALASGKLSVEVIATVFDVSVEFVLQVKKNKV